MTDAEQRAGSRALSIERLDRAMATVRRVMQMSQDMIDRGAGDRATNEQRLIDGELELAAMQQQLDALRVDDGAAFRGAASTVPTEQRLDPKA